MHRRSGPRTRAIVGRYETRPDRCTLVPAGCTDEEKLTNWLTADRRAFVDLYATR